MSLPAGQQRVLDRMDDALRAGEPHLNSMYAMFTRLSMGEPIATEQLTRNRLRCVQRGSVMYAIVLIPVMFAAIVVGALLGGTARGASVCKASYSMGGVSPLAGVPSCPPPAKSSVVKIAARKAVTGRLACAVKGSPARFTTLAQNARAFPAVPLAARTPADAAGAC